jgi:hypothetical protein
VDVRTLTARRNLVALAVGLLMVVAVSVVLVESRHRRSTQTAFCYASFDAYRDQQRAPSATVRGRREALDACQNLWALGVVRDSTIDDPAELRYRSLQACAGPHARMIVFPRRAETCQLLGLH